MKKLDRKCTFYLRQANICPSIRLPSNRLFIHTHRAVLLIRNINIFSFGVRVRARLFVKRSSENGLGDIRIYPILNTYERKMCDHHDAVCMIWPNDCIRPLFGLANNGAKILSPVRMSPITLLCVLFFHCKCLFPFVHYTFPFLEPAARARLKILIGPINLIAHES